MTIVLRIFLDREIVKMELVWVVMIMTGSSADIRPILCKSEGVSVVGRDRCRSPGCSWRCCDRVQRGSRQSAKQLIA